MAADETPVTLDDLATVGLERIEAEYHVDDLGICRRCGGVVFMSPYSEDTHRRWHAAIEAFTVTGTFTVIDPITKVPSFDAWTPRPITVERINPEGGPAGDLFERIMTEGDECGRHRKFIDRVWELAIEFGHENGSSVTDWLHAELSELAVTRRSAAASAQTDPKGSHALWTSATPEQRRELVVALGLDPNRATDCGWPIIMDQVRQHTTGVWRGELERLRRVEDALIAVGAPNHSERGDPGGLVVAWIRRQAELMSELRAKDQAAKQAVKLLAERPTRDAYVLALEEPERCRSALVEALGLDQNTGFYAALDVARGWRLELEAVRRGIADREIDATITRRHHALLMLAAKGRQEYADGAPDDQAQKLGFEADVFLTAANLVAQPNRIGMLIPYRMQTAVALAEVGVDYPVGEVQGDGTVVVREPAPAEQPAEVEVCPSLYLWHDTDDNTHTLLECKHGKGHPPQWGHKSVDGGHWDDAMAVPSPWPVDREPPAGINLLRDTGSQLVPYLARVQNGWGWLEDPPNGLRTHGGIQWAEAVLDVDGDLVVVRP